LVIDTIVSNSFVCESTSFTAVDGVHLAIDSGQLLCLLGHNGAGKTTTINMLTGMLPITSGDALIYGKQCTTDMDAIRYGERIFFCFFFLLLLLLLLLLLFH